MPSNATADTNKGREPAIAAGAVPPGFFDHDEQKSIYYTEKGAYADEHDDAYSHSGYVLNKHDPHPPHSYHDDEEAYYYYDEDAEGLKHHHPSMRHHEEKEEWTDIDPNEQYGEEGFVIYHDYLPRLGKTPDLERQRQGERRGTIKVY